MAGVLGLLRVVHRAMDRFDTSSEVLHWMVAHNESLGGLSPVDLVDTLDSYKVAEIIRDMPKKRTLI